MSAILPCGTTGATLQQQREHKQSTQREGRDWRPKQLLRKRRGSHQERDQRPSVNQNSRWSAINPRAIYMYPIRAILVSSRCHLSKWLFIESLSDSIDTGCISMLRAVLVTFSALSMS